MIDDEPPASLIVPRIVLDFPSTGKSDAVFTEDDMSVERKFVADLSIAYAFDLSKHFRMVARRDLIRLELTEEEVHEVALDNLSERMEKLQPDILKLSNGVFVFSSGGDFEATMLLLDIVWDQAVEIMRSAESLQGALVASAPSRNTLMFTSAENYAGLAFMRSRALEIIEAGDHPLTRHFLIREDGSWKKYEGAWI